MKKNIILLCALLCLCPCLAACRVQPAPEANAAPVNSGALENEIPNVEITVKKALHVSEVPYALPSGNDADSGGVDVDLRVYVEEAYNSIILFDILGSDVVMDYAENVYKHMDMLAKIQTPFLYHMTHHFGVNLEDLLEAADTGRYGRQYDKDLLRAMFLPYEDMLEETLDFNGAYLNGTVHNIQTLNELFENDKDAFAQIRLNELIDYQERLEENGIDYGFNEGMVEYANQYCIAATSTDLLGLD